MEYLDKETFKEKVFDFETNGEEWSFEGDKPCLIDFYADWCQPCKKLNPILEELEQEFSNDINIYKVDTEQQQELASMFGIRSIPSLLFCPLDDEPQMAQGAMPKSALQRAINEILLGKKEEAEQ